MSSSVGLRPRSGCASAGALSAERTRSRWRAPSSGSICWKALAAWHTPLNSISTSSAPTSWRTAPAACARDQQLIEHADDLRVGGADVVVGEERVGDGVEQGAVELLATDDLVDEPEQRPAGVGRVEQLSPPCHRLAHPLDHDRCDQVLLGREVAEQRPASDAGARRDLADAHLEAALAEQGLGGVQQTAAVSLGVCP